MFAAVIASAADITVVIATRNRAESLRETLAHLARADRTSLHCEVVIVDNGGSDHTPVVARQFAADFPVHSLVEPRPGKGPALNRALDEAPLGAIVAVLDDDMSPHPDWWQGVRALSGRWPQHDWFTGRSYIVWPVADVPAWCRRPYFSSWAFSVMDWGPRDREVAAGRWFSGNHFWFRRRALQCGARFDEALNLRTHIDVSQAQFMLQLADLGFRGVLGPDAVCGHRIQPELLDSREVLRRAARTGRGFAWTRLRPYKATIKQARLLREHKLLGRLYAIASVAGWTVVGAVARLHPRADLRLEWRARAIERVATYREILRLAGELPEYRLSG